jgi:hypothetical protein
MTTYPLIHRSPSPVGHISTFDLSSIFESNTLEYYFGGGGRGAEANSKKTIFRIQKRAIRSMI